MAYEVRDNTGTLFKNDRKELDTHPDYNGKALISGVEYWISAWIKEGKTGKFFSFSFKPKDAPPQTLSRVETKAPTGIDDEIPF